MTNYTLVGNLESKLPRHEGIFTQSYPIARAVYDAAIRNWNISYQNNLFSVESSDKIIEQVYYNSHIRNCSCLKFLETQCGTCMHIEAINLLKLWDKDLPKISPIVYLNHEFKIKQLGVGDNPFFTPSVKPFVNFIQKNSLSYNEEIYDNVDIFSEYNISLYDFQQESIKTMLKNKKTVLILKMGLGKTLCALACTKILDKNKIIIVAPNSLKYQWQKQIQRFNLGTTLIANKAPDLLSYKNQKFLILSYELLNRNPEIVNETYDILIADEIQKIKNPDSVSWKTLSQIKSEYVFSLSGTPIQNNFSDLLSLINFLNPKENKPEWKFYQDFCSHSKAKMFGIKQDKLEAIRNKFSRYIVNPKIDWDKFKLPTANETTINVKLTPEQRELHDSYLEPAHFLIAKSMNYPLTYAEQNKLNSLLTMAMMVATDARLLKPENKKSLRFEEIENYITKLVSSDKKVIVYSGWIKALNLLNDFLDKNNIPYVHFNGKLNAKKRDHHLNQFIEDDNIKVFLSTDSGGLGIDGLQLVCNHVIHIENIWNPMKIDQRNGRLVRKLQKEDVVNINYCRSDAEIEEMISKAHGRKHGIIADMFSHSVDMS